MKLQEFVAQSGEVVNELSQATAILILADNVCMAWMLRFDQTQSE